MLRLGNTNKVKAGVSVVVFLLTALWLASPGTAQEPRGKVTIATASFPVKIDPQDNGWTYPFKLTIFEGLMRRWYDGKLGPCLATSWQMGSDGLSYEFILRKGVTFHDGEVFSAQDVVFTDKRMREEGRTHFFAGPWKTKVTAVEAVGEDKVIFRLSAPDAAFVNYMDAYLTMVPKDFIEKVGTQDFKKHLIGTGAYKFVSFAPKEHYNLEANPNWWKGLPHVKHLNFRYVPEMLTRVAMLQTGEADIVDGVAPFMAKQLRETPGLGVTTAKAIANYMIILSNLDKQHPYCNVKVRKALNHAVDRKAIVDNIYFGYAMPASQIITPFYTGYDPKLEPYPYDPEKAKALLAEEGYAQGFDGGVLYCTAGELSEAVAATIQAWLADVGVKAKIQALELGEFTARQAKQGLQPAHITGDYTASFDAGTGFPRYFVTGGYRSHVSTPEWDDAINKATLIIDPEARAKALQEVSAMLHEEAACVPLLHPDLIAGYRTDRMEPWAMTAGFMHLRGFETIVLKKK